MKYNAKNHGGHLLKWLRFKAFSFVKNRQAGRVTSKSKKKTILIYPAFKSHERLLKILIKASYAFPRNDHLEFHLTASRELFSTAQNNLKKLLVATNHQVDGLKISRYDSTSNTEFKSYDLILCHKAKALPRIIKYSHKTEVIDELFYSYAESLAFQKAYYHLIDEDHKSTVREISDRNYSRLFTKLAQQKVAYCFLTGPSIGRYRDMNIHPDAVKVVCNSLVKNKAFLSFIQGPDIITFADPVFHFGVSEYAIHFREHLLEVVRAYKPFVVVPEFTLPLLLAWFPELEPYVIGLQTTESQDFILPSPANPKVRATDNIMTMFMLPLAAALANHVFVVGADGREKQESYFWKFNPDSQFTKELDSVFAYHPSFFRDRNYGSYYKEHCRLVEDLIQHMENKGKSVTSETPSFIPALSKRLKKHKHES